MRSKSEDERGSCRKKFGAAKDSNEPLRLISIIPKTAID
jgi:hypothetical protein